MMSKAISHWALQRFGYTLSLVSLSKNIYSSIILTDVFWVLIAFAGLGSQDRC